MASQEEPQEPTPPKEEAVVDQKNVDEDAPAVLTTKDYILGIGYFIGMIAFIIVLALVFKNINDDDDKQLEVPPTAAPTVPEAFAFSLNIYHINDHHSHLDQDDFSLSGEEVGLSNVDEVTVNFGGFPRLVSLFKSLEAEGGNYLKLHAGDALTGTSYYSLFEGVADAAMMSQVCFDAFALGNHEFDGGDENLATFLSDLVDDECPETAILSANLVPGESSPLQDLIEEGTLLKNKVFDFDGESVGVVGIDIRNKTMLSSSPDEGTELLDEVEIATSQVEELIAAGVNKIVMLTHIGYDNDLEWMVEIPGVDVVVGGDSHSLLGDEDKLGPVGFPVGPYPTTVEASDGRKVCVVTAWEYAHGVGTLGIHFDEDGAVVSCGGATVFPFDPIIYGDDTELSTDDANTVIEYLEGLDFVALEEDADAKAALQSYSEQVEVLRQTVIATVPEGICFERIPGQGRSTICSADETSMQGGGVCNLVAQAFLSQAFTADVAIQNGGGCRTDIYAGNFTMNDAYTLLPFSNTLVTLEMTGAQIHNVLEDAVENALIGSSTGAYPYASGLRYSVNGRASFGSRVADLEVNERLEGEWAAISMETVYTVVTNDYIATGSDGYFEFAEIDSELVTDLYLEYAQTFIDYAQDVGVLEDPPTEWYSTKSYVAPPVVDTTLTILHVNDHHSHLDEDDFDLAGSDIGIDVDVTVTYGGYPLLVSLFSELESANSNVLKLHAGDAITGTSYYTLFKGVADASMMGYVCFDAFTLGNHEFDGGDSDLATFLEELQGNELCPDTPVLSANLAPHDDSPLKTLMDDSKLLPSAVYTLEDGAEIGVIGINIRNKTMFSSAPDAGTEYMDEVETATAEVEALEASGVNKIVLLTHIGYNYDLSWMVDIPGVDVIVGGDSHSLLGDEDNLAPVGFPVGAYPTAVTASDGRTVCVVTAWEYAHGVGKLDIEFDEAGDVISCGGQTVFPFDSTTISSDAGVVSDSDAAAVVAYLEGLGGSFMATTPDADTQAALDIYAENVAVLRQTVIATVPEGICFERIPGQGRSTICTPEETSSQGGGVCNLVAKAFMLEAFTADVAIQNGGGCRTDIHAGNLTIDDAFKLLPFSNTLVSLDMTGTEIQLVLEQAVDNALIGGSTGAYPYASGLRYDVDGSAEFGSRVINLEINSRLEGEWALIDMSAVYTVVTNDYIAAGRDGYLAFADIETDLITDLFLEYAQTFINYAQDVGVVEDVPLEEYSTKSFIAAP